MSLRPFYRFARYSPRGSRPGVPRSSVWRTGTCCAIGSPVPSAPDRLELFESTLRNASAAATLVKVTLSMPSKDHPGLRNLKARPVQLKDGRRLCVVECHATRETTQNHQTEEGVARLIQAFSQTFERAHVFTTAGDFQFRRERSGQVSVRGMRPVFSVAGDLAHDRSKKGKESLACEPFLQRLGVTNADGSPRPGMAAKLRQVHRFVEILGHLLAEISWDATRPIRVADMGAGKGYLTFALAHAFRSKGWDARVTGVELREELVEKGNLAARELGFEHLQFVSGSIGQWKPEGALDVLVGLHACDTATDDALYQGVQAGAALILTSPCCHRELRRQIRLPETLGPVGRHGILLERQAEILTDTLRAELLEISGYSARVFEFVEPEHSGKNLMLAGVRRASGGRVEAVDRQVFLNLWTSFGLSSQRLANLLGEEPK